SRGFVCSPAATVVYIPRVMWGRVGRIVLARRGVIGSVRFPRGRRTRLLGLDSSAVWLGAAPGSVGLMRRRFVVGRLRFAGLRVGGSSRRLWQVWRGGRRSRR
ncbi:MAG: hypothetical protein ACYS8L_09945, partial [Planctomycetota bacterium]